MTVLARRRRHRHRPVVRDVASGGSPDRWRDTHTGDLIVADTDGVVIIPAQAAEDTLDRADARVAVEEHALAAIRNGASTLDLYNLRERIPQ